MLTYVRLTFNATATKRRSVWAKRLPATGDILRYQRVSVEGESIEPHELILLARADVVRECPAAMNNHYGELEILPLK